MADLRKIRRRTPRPLRVFLLGLVALAIIVYVTWGVVHDDLVMPGPGSRSNHHPPVHFHGIPALIVAGAFLLFVLGLLNHLVRDLATPEGRKVDQSVTTMLCGIGFAIFAVMEILKWSGLV